MMGSNKISDSPLRPGGARTSLRGHCARFGSLADIAACLRDVRFQLGHDTVSNSAAVLVRARRSERMNGGMSAIGSRR